MAFDRLHIVCYRWGRKYLSEDVNILRAMVSRNLSVPHVFHCVTDDPTGLDPAIVAHPLPDLGFEGIWRKLMTFSEDFLGLGGEYVVSVDLDVVIVDSIDFVSEATFRDFTIARNWGDDGRASGTLYGLRVGSMKHLWDRFIADPQAAIERHHSKDRFTGEQIWLDTHVENFDFYPEDKIVSFKKHCNAKGLPIFRSKRLGLDFGALKLGTAQLPKGAAVVSFHGNPLPRDMLGNPPGYWKRAPFVRQHWRL